MIPRLFSLSLVLIVALASSAGLTFPTPAGESLPSPAFELWGDPQAFIENVGQFDPQVRFQARAAGYTIWLAQDAIWFSLLEPLEPASQPALLPEERFTNRPALAPRRGVHLRLSFVGANPQPRLEPFERLDTQVSYFKGSHPASWRSAVPVWSGLRYLDLYPGVDLELRGQGGQLIPRLLVRPGASLEAVRLQVQGAEEISLDGERLRLTTAIGEVSLPLFQLAGAGSPAPSLPSLQGDQLLRPFASPSFAGSPLTPHIASSLVYATFIGGSSLDSPYGMAVSSSGSMFLTGVLISTNFPATPGAFDLTLAGQSDAFVARLDPSGASLVYATYLGGSGLEMGKSIAVDASDAAYITGSTTSTDFPTSPGAFDQTLGAFSSADGDAFVVKLNPTGAALLYATYLGGKADDVGMGIAVDPNGVAYVAGDTKGGSFPTTSNAYDSSFNGNYDHFVTRLNPQGSALLYSTYMGGEGNEYVADMALDLNGAVYLTGSAGSSYPTTPGAFDPTPNGCWDAYVTRLDASGSALDYATFLGGSGGCTPSDSTGFDWGTGIAVDASGSVYVAGGSSSSDFPVTVGAYDPTYNGDMEVFVAHLNPSGSDLLYATFLGGKGWDAADDLAIDAGGAAYITGQTLSYDFPTTPGAFDVYRTGGDDAFAAKFSPSGASLLYSTYLGGDDREYGRNIAVDSSRAVYLSGNTGSANFPSTAGSYDPTHNGADDAFAIKMWMAAANADTYILAPAWSSALPGGVVNIPVSYGNAGLTLAASPLITATLHSGLTYLSDTTDIPPIVNGQTLVWGLPGLPFSASGSFYLRLRLPAAAPPATAYPVRLQIASSGIEDNPTDNDLTLQAVASLKIYLPLVRR